MKYLLTNKLTKEVLELTVEEYQAFASRGSMDAFDITTKEATGKAAAQPLAEVAKDLNDRQSVDKQK